MEDEEDDRGEMMTVAVVGAFKAQRSRFVAHSDAAFAFCTLWNVNSSNVI